LAEHTTLNVEISLKVTLNWFKELPFFAFSRWCYIVDRTMVLQFSFGSLCWWI